MKPTFSMVRDVLEHCGPMTSHEVAKFLGIENYRHVSSILSALRIRVVTQQVYIQSWTYEGVGNKRYPRAVYALGAEPDARKPRKQNNTAKCRRYRAVRKSRVNSVWAWGGQ